MKVLSLFDGMAFKTMLRQLISKWGVMSTEMQMAYSNDGAGVPKRQIDIVKPGGVYDYGKFKISPVRLYHNVPNCGYRVYFGDEKLIYATDTNTMAGITAQNYDLFMIEANYTTAEIQERIAQKQRAGEYAYETQVLHNHLSFEAAQQWLADNIGGKICVLARP